MIKVMVIDDSAVVRNAFGKILQDVKDVELIATASNPVDAFNEFKKVGLPDVFILDIEMPKMDGLTFLKQINEQKPTPVIMCSTLVASGSKAAIAALGMGAVGLIEKPSTQLSKFFNEYKEEFIELIHTAYESKIHFNMSVDKKTINNTKSKKSSYIIAIGASTGGTIAIRQIISEYPPSMPGTVIVQHMPPKFTKLYADKLNDVAAVEVKEAQTGDRIQAGRVLIAPGDSHLEVIRSGGEYRVRCRIGEKVNGHCPSVEVLFNSVSEHVGSNAIGLMLTGMGRDGATAMLNMRNAGARTLAQDEESSVVFGMPNEAYKCGGAERLVSLDNITASLIQLLKKI